MKISASMPSGSRGTQRKGHCCLALDVPRCCFPGTGCQQQTASHSRRNLSGLAGKRQKARRQGSLYKAVKGWDQDACILHPSLANSRTSPAWPNCLRATSENQTTGCLKEQRRGRGLPARERAGREGEGQHSRASGPARPSPRPGCSRGTPKASAGALQ